MNDTTLEKQLKKRLEDKDILLMTHIVLGYPSFEDNRKVIKQMVENGVDCIEMQIPFSEPMADGPVILKANQDSLANGTRVEDCFQFATEMTKTYDIPFLFMTYYNIVFKYGERDFIKRAKDCNIKGFIIPDLPPEQGELYLRLTTELNLSPIFIYTPTSTDERMKTISTHSSGFIYCVARRGVTGKKSDLDTSFGDYIKRCRQATSLPLAVGFGIRSKEDIDLLIGNADIAVIGSQTIQIVDQEGVNAVGPFIAGLR